MGSHMVLAAISFEGLLGWCTANRWAHHQEIRASAARLCDPTDSCIASSASRALSAAALKTRHQTLSQDALLSSKVSTHVVNCNVGYAYFVA